MSLDVSVTVPRALGSKTRARHHHLPDSRGVDLSTLHNLNEDSLEEVLVESVLEETLPCLQC